METIGALVGCGAALAVGAVLGYRWTLGTPWHLIAGLLVGAACTAIYFVVATWVGRAMPGTLEARQVGVNFMVLMPAAPLVGLMGAWFGYRKSIGRGLFPDRRFP